MSPAYRVLVRIREPSGTLPSEIHQRNHHANIEKASTFLPTPCFPRGRRVHPRMVAGIFLGHRGTVAAVLSGLIEAPDMVQSE